MSFKTTALLFGTMMGVLWLFGLMNTLQRGKLDEGFVVPTLARDETAKITTVEIEREGHKYTFFDTDTGWRLRIDTHPQELRADESKVREVINDIQRARRTEEADVTRNLSQWGLQKPVEKILLKEKGGTKEWTLNVGKESPDGTYLYVNSSDRPRDVLAVRKVKLKSVLVSPKNIDKYRSLRLLDVSDATARLVGLKPGAGTKGRELVLEKGKDAVWQFKKPHYGLADYEGVAKSREPTGVRGLINTLDAIRVEKDADFEPLSKSVFPADKALLAVQVVGTRDSAPGKPGKQTLLIGPKVETKAGGKEKGAVAEQYYARLANDQAVVRVDARNVNILLGFTRKPDALRSRDLAQLERPRTDAIRISSGKGLADVITLYKPLLKWEVSAGTLKHAANDSAIQGPGGLLDAIQGKGKVKDFFDVIDEAKEGKVKDKELGLDHPTAQVQVWANGLEKESKKGEKKGAKNGEKKEPAKTPEGPHINAKVKPVVTLVFGKTAGGMVYVKRETADGAVSRVSVPVAELHKIARPGGALAYLDPNVAPFKDVDVAKLELKVAEGKGERVFVVERETAKEAKGKEKLPLTSGWLLREPKSFAKDRPSADRGGVDRTLIELARLSALKYVRKVEGQKELGEYGLAAPAVTAVVTLKKKDGQKEATTYTYLFGKEAKAEKGKAAGGIYAVLSSGSELKNIVFEVSALTLTTLKDVELRDRTVFRFDPDKVKEIKLAYQQETELRKFGFVRKLPDKNWTAESLSGFNLEPAQVDQLLTTLSDLKALRYVSFKGPEKEHGLEKPKLRVDVVMDDGKTTYSLTVGNAAKEGPGYYAMSRTLPNTIFLVPQPDFRGVIDHGVAHFSKK